MRKEIEKVATFLNKPLSDEQLNELRERLRFENFAKNEAVNFETLKKFGAMDPDGHFIRKGIFQNSRLIYTYNLNLHLGVFFVFFFQGKTGDWKNHFSPSLNDRIEEWMDKHLKGTDLKFATELDFQD